MSQLHDPCMALPLLLSHVCVSGQVGLPELILRRHILLLHSAHRFVKHIASPKGSLIPEDKSDVFSFIIQSSQCIIPSTPVIVSHRPLCLYVVLDARRACTHVPLQGWVVSQGDPCAGGWMSRQSCLTQCRGTCSRKQGRPACKPSCSSTWRQASATWACFCKWSTGL